MREMILNHVSVVAGDKHSATEILCDVTQGMAELVREKYTQSILRSKIPLCEILYDEEASFYDLILSLKGRARDEYSFLLRLNTKAPLEDGLCDDVKDRFRGCEATNISQEAGETLVLCALMSAVAISFPSTPDWDCDKLDVTFDELLSDDTFEEVVDSVDHLSKSEHASIILARWRETLRSIATPIGIWQNREISFPELTFGSDVEEHLLKVNAGMLPAIIKRLSELNDTVCEWRESGCTSPPWASKVTDESDTVKNTPNLKRERYFSSVSGKKKYYFYHARYVDGGRIHIRIDQENKTIEIGYIGKHLRLP